MKLVLIICVMTSSIVFAGHHNRGGHCNPPPRPCVPMRHHTPPPRPCIPMRHHTVHHRSPHHHGWISPVIGGITGGIIGGMITRTYAEPVVTDTYVQQSVVVQPQSTVAVPVQRIWVDGWYETVRLPDGQIKYIYHPGYYTYQ